MFLPGVSEVVMPVVVVVVVVVTFLVGLVTVSVMPDCGGC